MKHPQPPRHKSLKRQGLTPRRLIEKSSTPLRQILRYAEWALLLMVPVVHVIESYTPVSYKTDGNILKAIGFNLVFFGLSFIFPIDRPSWQRRIYIAMEIILVISALAMRVNNEVLLYFLLIKSCFLLSRREVVFTVFITGIAYLGVLYWMLPSLQKEVLEQIHKNPNEIETQFNPLYIIPTAFVAYLCISIFVVLIGFLIVAERNSKQRAETLSQEVKTLAATVERTRIARNIHDAVGHTLTTLGVQLEVAQKLRRHDPEKALMIIDTAKLLSDQCLEDVRLALQTIHQSDFDFDQALQILIDQVKQNSSFTIKTEVNLMPLSTQTGQQLYRIIQEGLTNIRKHAKASHVSLKVSATVERIHLTLIDNGKGFDPTLSYRGFGLQGIKQRVKVLDGEITVNSTLGKGTQIHVSVPQ
jgi:signal transduction histidine kinase